MEHGFPETNNSSLKLGYKCHTNLSASVPENDPNSENGLMLYPTLDYINRILQEEDIDGQFNGYQEVTALADIEKQFYDILEENLPDDQLDLGQSNSNHNSTTPISNDPIIPSLVSTSLSQDSKAESLLAMEFKRGMEEGMKFLPTINNIVADFQGSRLSLDTTLKNSGKSPKNQSEVENAHGLVMHKAKKSTTNADHNIECRNGKMPMLSTDETIRDELFDKVLLNHGEEYEREEISHLRERMKWEACPQFTKMNYTDNSIYLESLLIQCSEAIADNNCKIAEELIKEIRKHASPIGTGAQRLACILSDGLEARLAGRGSEIYRLLINRRVSTREIFKAYHMYITASPLLRVSYCFANDYICKVAENASNIHVVDLGITFGFQWPLLIQALAKRKGGPPKLRITGIDLPQPGFRPAERIKQTGVRLGEYAKSFGVHFEYHFIASLWECICINDLKINDDEVLIVNNMFRFKEIRDETFTMDSPRNRVLNLIRQLKPKVFILGEYNVVFSPFFIKRFRKVLWRYSLIFDMFDTLVPRGDNRRQLMERELLAPVILNLVACEGFDWVERPETYKQWHRRISQAGFHQIPMDQNLVRDCNNKVKSSYHEGFFIEEDSGWMLQGWRGRINYCLSVWEPKLE